VLDALRAVSAQLYSVEHALFKNEPFVSWQTAGFVVEALRAACAVALLASEDAGGQRRTTWSELYSSSDLFIRRLARCSPKLDGFMDLESSIPLLAAVSNEADENDGDVDNAQIDPNKDSVTDKRRPSLNTLNKETLEGLLRHVASLDAHAERDPGLDDDAASFTLDRALRHAKDSLDILSAALEDRGQGDHVPDASRGTPPWVQARDFARQRIEEAAKVGTEEENSSEAKLNESNENQQQTEA